MSAVDLVFPRADLRVWHAELARRLSAEGSDVACLVQDGPPPPLGLRLTEALERRLYAATCGVGSASLPEHDLPFRAKHPRARAVLVDLTGDERARPDALVPLWNGAAGTRGLVAAALQRRAAHVALTREGRVIASARPAFERPDMFTASRDALVATFCDMLARHLAGRPPPLSAEDAPPDACEPTPPLRFLAETLWRKARRRVGSPRLEAWSVGWRRHAGDTILRDMRWPAQGFASLPDDGERYYADPFLFERDGRVFVFVEEYPFATGRGVISVTDVTDGAPAAPRIVLERPWHLSYPNVFAHAGEIWMAPESSAACRLELFRAKRFPDEWELAGELVSDAPLNDATFFEHDGSWWMTASETSAHSSWDALVLYSAPSPLGPWRREGRDPVLIDAATARPAGAVTRVNGALLRPVQDCVTGYGSALSLCRIDALGADRFVQTRLARIAPPKGAIGLHTLNANASHEAVDILKLVGRAG